MKNNKQQQKVMSNLPHGSQSNYSSPADAALESHSSVAMRAHQQPSKPELNEFMLGKNTNLNNQVKSASEDASDINSAMNNAGYNQPPHKK